MEGGSRWSLERCWQLVKRPAGGEASPQDRKGGNEARHRPVTQVHLQCRARQKRGSRAVPVTPEAPEGIAHR